MAILPETPNTDDSPFYTLMENKAVAWDRFAEKTGLESKGNYNAYIVSFVLKGQFGQNELRIEGKRALLNTSSGFSTRRSQISEILRINFSESFPDPKHHVSVSKNNLLNRWSQKFRNFQLKKTIGPYLVNCNSEKIYELIDSSDILAFQNIYRISVGNEGMKVWLFELPERDSELQVIYNFFQNLLSAISSKHKPTLI